MVWVCAGSFLKPLDSLAVAHWYVDATMESWRGPRFSVAWVVMERPGPITYTNHIYKTCTFVSLMMVSTEGAWEAIIIE
jgi:hypothetical protein